MRVIGPMVKWAAMSSGNGRLRVIGGILKGRRLDTLPGESIRPTGDRVREALFDILGQKVSGAAFLDIYAGTGAIGIEALSRGAREVTFIESDAAAADLIHANLSRSAAEPARARVIAREATQAVALLDREQLRFDFIYLDPPYQGGVLELGLRAVASSRLLKKAVIVIAEHEASAEPPSCPGLSAYRTARYGRAAITFYASVDADAAR